MVTIEALTDMLEGPEGPKDFIALTREIERACRFEMEQDSESATWPGFLMAASQARTCYTAALAQIEGELRALRQKVQQQAIVHMREAKLDEFADALERGDYSELFF